jgi:PII-like signaling protein
MMLHQGPAKKVTIYVGEAVKHRHEPVFMAVLNYLFYHNVANATVTRGAGGFGADHRMQMARRATVRGAPVMTLSGAAKMMRIHFGDDDRWEGRPLHDALVEEARRQDLAGATVYRGIEGYGASSRIHRKRLLTSSDLPVMVCIIDTAAKIQAFLPTVERMVGDGLIAISDVEVIRYAPRREPASGA